MVGISFCSVCLDRTVSCHVAWVQKVSVLNLNSQEGFLFQYMCAKASTRVSLSNNHLLIRFDFLEVRFLLFQLVKL